jgi:hypothetical protein
MYLDINKKTGLGNKTKNQLQVRYPTQVMVQTNKWLLGHCYKKYYFKKAHIGLWKTCSCVKLGVGGEKQETKLYFCYDPNYLENDSICAEKKRPKC